MNRMLTESHELVLTSCCACGVQFAMPEPLEQHRRDTGDTFWCPNGHTLAYRSRIAELEKKLKAEKERVERYEARITHEHDQRLAAERSAAAARGQVTKLKNRAAAGVCPCCKRHFVNLERHMGTKHPDFTRGASS